MQVNRERLKCISGIPEVLYASGELRTGAVTPKSAGITWLMKKTGAERGKPRR